MEGYFLKKVICEYCGTVYDAEKGACSICGSPYSPENSKPYQEPSGERADALAPEETPKAPTIPIPDIPQKKKPKGKPAPEQREAPPQDGHAKGRYAGKVSRRDKTICVILGIFVVCLLLYVGYRILSPYWSSADQPVVTTPPTSETVPCVSLAMETSLTLTAQGQSQTLHVAKTPVDATEALQFVSDHPSVATVSPEGRVEAVGPGQATITVTCGQASAVCTVTCAFTPAESTAPEAPTEAPGESTSEPTSEPGETTEPTGKLTLSATDITLFQKGETARLTVGSLAGSQLQWSSEDEAIATVENGVVTAKGPGVTHIRAVYEEQEFACVVRCNFEDVEDAEAVISHTDVTLDVDESFTLRLRDGDGQTLDVTWSAGNSNVCTVDGNTITAVGSGYTEITTTYEGTTYTCIVRVN